MKSPKIASHGVVRVPSRGRTAFSGLARANAYGPHTGISQ